MQRILNIRILKDNSCVVYNIEMKHPEEIHGVSQSIFSTSRHYGGCYIQGRYYVYDPLKDSLVREDIFKERTSKKKEEKGDQLNLLKEG